MKIRIIAVGKLKENFYKEATKEYIKRLTKYIDIEIVEVNDSPTKQDASVTENNLVLEEESSRIMPKILDDSIVISMDIKGLEYSSTDLADLIKDKYNNSKDITLIIGGSLGLSKQILDKSDYRISFGKITMPHQLFRVVLVEQIYRSFRIIRNEPYHK